MPKYPNGIYTPREKENRASVSYDPTKKTVIFAEDFKNSDAEIVAVQTELGTNPKGAFASVKDFLAYLLSKVVSAFTDLTDVPTSYVGQAGKAVIVKSTEDGLEFGSPPGPPGSAGWELIRTGTFTNDINITELNGNADKLWQLIIRTNHINPYTTHLRFNFDHSISYGFSRHASGVLNGAAIHASWGSGIDDKIHLFIAWFLNQFSTIIIDATTGKKRMLTHLGSESTDLGNSISLVGEGRWENSTDNIHTINIVTGEITAGEFWLFRKRL